MPISGCSWLVFPAGLLEHRAARSNTGKRAEADGRRRGIEAAGRGHLGEIIALNPPSQPLFMLISALCMVSSANVPVCLGLFKRSS